MAISTVSSRFSALLVVGALEGGAGQTGFFAGAVAVDWGGVYLTSRHGGWRLHSVSHWCERHGLFVILLIGESVIAIGTGAARQPVSTSLIVLAVLGVATAVCLWWLYFDVVSLAAERRLSQHRGQARVLLAIEAYTYGHFPIVAGIVVAALGVEGVLARTTTGDSLGLFYAAALYGGVALYLGGHVAFKRRLHGAWGLPRLVVLGALLATIPAAALLTPIMALAAMMTALAAVVWFETRRYAEVRSRVRSLSSGGSADQSSE